MNKIRKGDQVVVLSGKDKGRQGTVLSIDGEKITVENVNKAKKHQKPRQSKGVPVQGGIIDKVMPLHISKVALWNAAAKKADRVGIKQLKDGKRVRFFKSNGEVIDA
jgi:large subunit ribosomal protein L24